MLVARLALQDAGRRSCSPVPTWCPFSTEISCSRSIGPLGHPNCARASSAPSQRRGSPVRVALETFRRQLVAAAREPLRSCLQLQAIVARPRSVRAGPNLDYDLG